MTSMFLNEDAYYRVLKAFAAGSYDLKKEMLLAKLRKELVIPDQRHEALRAMIEDGRELKERDYLKQPVVPAQVNYSNGRHVPHPKRHRSSDSSEDEGFARAGGTTVPPESPFEMPSSSRRHSTQGNGSSLPRPAKRQRKDVDSREFMRGIGLPATTDINELIGYKIQRWWPENGGWFEGAITDYRATTGEHCIVYDMNTPSESYEWFDMSISREDEFKLLRDRINIIEHAPRSQHQAAIAPRRVAEGYRAGLPGSRIHSVINGQLRGQSDAAAPMQRAGRGNAVTQPSAFAVESNDSISSDDSFSD